MSHPNAASELLPENRAETNDVECSAEAPNAHQPPRAPIEAFHLASSADLSNDMALRPPAIRSSGNAEDDGIASDGINESEAARSDGDLEDPVQAAGMPNTQRGYTYSAEAPRISAQNRRTLGIPKADFSKGAQRLNAMGVGDGGFIGAFDYDKKYPADRYGEEMGPEARVWKIYLDEAAEDDRFRIENLRDTLDVILVFAGLFSAVVTTFVVHTVEILEDDRQMTKTESLLAEMICIQRSVASGASLDNCRSSFSFQQSTPANPSSTDHAVNALFFVSLTVALCTALAAVLTKQWIHHYLQPVTGSSRDRARKHQFRLDGFTRYRVESIIGLLPILIHVSLFLFFIGLGIFLATLHVATTVVVVSIIGMTLALYLVTNILPMFDIGCPYHTPLTTVIHDGPFRLFKRSFYRLHRLMSSRRRQHSKNSHDEGTSLKVREVESIDKRGQYWDIRCLGWLQTTTTDAKVHMATCSAFAGLPRQLTKESTKELEKPIYPLALRNGIESAFYNRKAHDERTIERLARAFTISAPYFPPSHILYGHDELLARFILHNLNHHSLAVIASVYSMQYSSEHIKLTEGDEYANFFVSFVIDRPDFVHPTVLSCLIGFALDHGSHIKNHLTLASSPVLSCDQVRDRAKSLEFLMKLVDLFDRGPLLSHNYRPPLYETLMWLITEILPIPSIGPKMVNVILTDRSYNRGLVPAGQQEICRAIVTIHLLAHLPLPVGEAELHMFGSSTREYDYAVCRAWNLEDQIRMGFGSALANAIQSVLNSNNNGPPPESWKVVFKVAYYAFSNLELETEECIQALLDLSEQVGERPGTIKYLQTLKPSQRLL